MGKKSTGGAAGRSLLVLRVLSKEEPAALIARRSANSEQTVYRWREGFIGGRQRGVELPVGTERAGEGA